MLSIVLLPGMDGTGSLFGPFIEALGSGFKPIVVRYPTDEGLGYAELEEIARQSLPKEGAFIILGESFSGPIAVSLASSNPPRLVGLVLCSTFIRNPMPVFGPLHGVVNFLPVNLVPSFVYNYFLLGRASTPLLTSSIKAAVGQVSGAAFRARVRAVLSVDVSDKMKLLSVPVLYLKASRDSLVAPAASTHITSIHPETQIVTIDAPHFLLQVAAKEAASAVSKFASEM
jgi:pimeloyl-ACP methyl ester carboxylesterase